MNKEIDLLSMAPSLAIRTAKTYNLELPPQLEADLKQARKEKQLYELKKAMLTQYPEEFSKKRKEIQSEIRELLDEWEQSIEKAGVKVDVCSNGRASERLIEQINRMKYDDTLKTELFNGSKQIKAEDDLFIPYPYNDLIDLV